MRNWKKYEKEVRESSGIFGVTTEGIVKRCNELNCHDCILSSRIILSSRMGETKTCFSARVDWLYSEYEPPKLKPCPFCGKSVAVFTDVRELEVCSNFDEDICKCLDPSCSDFPAIVCDHTKGGCGASTGYCQSEEEAIEMWNRRSHAKG